MDEGVASARDDRQLNVLVDWRRVNCQSCALQYSLLCSAGLSFDDLVTEGTRHRQSPWR